MTTQMQLAMQAAAAKAPGAIVIPPATQRIWQWLHDKGGHYTAKEIEIALKIPAGSVGSGLYELLSRGTAEKRPAQRRNASVHLQFEWKALGAVYTRPPVKAEFRKKPKAKALPQAAAVPVEKTPDVKMADPDRTFTAPGPTPEPVPAINIDGMTVREARALYRQLHTIFGGST